MDGTGETVGILELGGGFKTAEAFSNIFENQSITPPQVVAVSVDGGTNSPTNPNGADSEVMLDIEVAASVAPAAKIAVYFTPNTDQGFIDALTTAVHDTTNHPSVISISWGGPESGWTQQAMTALDDAASQRRRWESASRWRAATADQPMASAMARTMSIFLRRVRTCWLAEAQRLR